MNISKGILEEVAYQIGLHELSLAEAEAINSTYGWAIKGIPQKIHLSESDLLISYNELSKKHRNILHRPYSLNNSKFSAFTTVLSLVLSAYFFDGKVFVGGILGTFIGTVFLLVSVYLFKNTITLIIQKKQLTRKSSGWK